MKKHEIRKAVERSTEKHMKKAIDDEGRYRAHAEVGKAMMQEKVDEDAPKGTPVGEAAEHGAAHSGHGGMSTTEISSSDPRIAGTK